MLDTYDMVNKALHLMQKDAEKKRELAAQSGRHDDGGHGRMMDKIHSFRDGIEYAKSGEVPKWLLDYIEEAEKREDPDWNEYQRLKNKFEGLNGKK